MASVAATDPLVDGSPEVAAAAIHAIVKTQAALRANPERAAEVGRKLFPPPEGAVIAELIRRDLPFYDATISASFVADMNQFALDIGILHGDVAYDRVVATRFAALWHG
jgi:ABC-type nitrate/sulfonate/bicarbonate transport system substrate-binding protein